MLGESPLPHRQGAGCGRERQFTPARDIFHRAVVDRLGTLKKMCPPAQMIIKLPVYRLGSYFLPYRAYTDFWKLNQR